MGNRNVSGGMGEAVMYKGFIRFIIDMKSDSSTTLITYNFSISDKSFEFVKKSICACVKLLVLIGAKDIDCDFLYDPRKG